MPELRNLTSQAELKKRLEASNEPRTTISFYQYHPISDPQLFRNELYIGFESLGVLGRVYVAGEGINAQISVPTARFDEVRAYLETIDFLRGIRLNIALEDDGKSFWVLTVKARPKIVADGIEDPTFSMERKGAYIDAEKFNELAALPDTIVVDMRNYYEYEVGHFDNALEVSSDTFREQLPMAVKMLEGNQEKNIIMYCTGGIRCEKASAYLLHHGFGKVSHLEGGIIEYVRQVKERGLENMFKGKNFVFDNRLGEQITGDVISHCHQCGQKCDTHRNCENAPCHLLFIQCESCREAFAGCCSQECHDLRHLPPDQQERVGPAESEGSFNNSQDRRRVRFFDAPKGRVQEAGSRGSSACEGEH